MYLSIEKEPILRSGVTKTTMKAIVTQTVGTTISCSHAIGV